MASSTSLDQCRQHLLELTELKDGWFDGHGKAISYEALNIADNLLLGCDTLRPYIYPMIGGGVTMEWETDDGDDGIGLHKLEVIPMPMVDPKTQPYIDYTYTTATHFEGPSKEHPVSSALWCNPPLDSVIEILNNYRVAMGPRRNKLIAPTREVYDWLLNTQLKDVKVTVQDPDNLTICTADLPLEVEKMIRDDSDTTIGLHRLA